ncbi:unnamed protein product [Cuscuta epithymum]|uniref:Dof zinc finger protein n=1 Tax=Cuscuta epithymum TaxID=186058 RepID=A0AAV0CFM0_9ASTE|nr:unnamed protein product [Cuscuta epithymum]
MAFSSFPVYLDHPNLHQLQQSEHNHQERAGGGIVENPQLQTAPPQQPAPAGGGLASIRPGSMVDRARQAKIALPEAGLKCPRCESTHTKFCYFNNYSLTQPRHFCKTCRRYWTRGGALRNVPVGGGCRRNKRSKNNNQGSKSSSAGATANMEVKTAVDGGDGGRGGPGLTSSCISPTDIGRHFPQLPQTHMAEAFHQTLNRYDGSCGYPSGGVGIPPPHPVVANARSGGGIGELGFPFPYIGNGFDLLGSHSNMYPNFQSEGVEASSSLSPSTKMEENGRGLLSNSTKHFLGTLENNPYWGWTGGLGFSGLNSSSPTTHHLL